MIVLSSDFGLSGPYLGQMKAVLHQQAPGIPVVDLFSDAPAFNPRAMAYLMAAYYSAFPMGSVFLTVVDPGVGSDRGTLIMKADGRYFVGPDNGVFAILARGVENLELWEINYTPSRLSNSFHGRDLFAPVAAMIARGDAIPGDKKNHFIDYPDWPDDLAEIIYLDHYGNAITGLRACAVSVNARLELGGQVFGHARTFSAVHPGEGFWYENANGLVEIAVNQGDAREQFGIAPGDKLALLAG